MRDSGPTKRQKGMRKVNKVASLVYQKGQKQSILLKGSLPRKPSDLYRKEEAQLHQLEPKWEGNPYLQMIATPLRPCILTRRKHPTALMIRLTASYDPQASQNVQQITHIVPSQILKAPGPKDKGRGAWVICRRAALEALFGKGWQHLSQKLLYNNKIDKAGSTKCISEPDEERLIKQIQSQITRRIWQDLRWLADARSTIHKEVIEDGSITSTSLGPKTVNIEDDLSQLVDGSELDLMFDTVQRNKPLAVPQAAGALILLQSPIPNFLWPDAEHEPFSVIVNSTPVYSFQYILSHPETIFPPNDNRPHQGETIEIFRRLASSEKSWDGTATIIPMHVRTTDLLQSLWRARLWFGEGWETCDGLGIDLWKSKDPPGLIPRTSEAMKALLEKTRSEQNSVGTRP